MLAEKERFKYFYELTFLTLCIILHDIFERVYKRGRTGWYCYALKLFFVFLRKLVHISHFGHWISVLSEWRTIFSKLQHIKKWNFDSIIGNSRKSFFVWSSLPFGDDWKSKLCHCLTSFGMKNIWKSWPNVPHCT